MTTYIDKNIIAKAITNIAKKKNFNYSHAIEKRKKNYKAYKESKTNRELQKKLSKDRFNTYLEEKYKNDN